MLRSLLAITAGAWLAGHQPPARRSRADTISSIVPAVPRAPTDSAQVAAICRGLAERGGALAPGRVPDRMPRAVPDTAAFRMPRSAPDMSEFRMPVGRATDGPSARLPDGRVVPCPRD